MIEYLLTFFSSFAHTVGMWVLGLLAKILPAERVPWMLADPIGLLAIITALLILVEFARKVAWVLVVTAWVLLLVRIVMEVVG